MLHDTREAYDGIALMLPTTRDEAYARCDLLPGRARKGATTQTWANWWRRRSVSAPRCGKRSIYHDQDYGRGGAPD